VKNSPRGSYSKTPREGTYIVLKEGAICPKASKNFSSAVSGGKSVCVLPSLCPLFSGAIFVFFGILRDI